ncbi:MAG: sensor histidine kinase, partial [Gallionellaceae bacterium]|nr:sensor histidine kinase [Gallionellaceae bacterium]
VGINNTTVPVLHLVNAVFPTLFAAEVHLLVAFPAGRLSSMRERALVASAYFAGTILQAARYGFDVNFSLESVGWNPYSALSVTQLTLATLVGIATAALLILRLARAWPNRLLALVYGGGMLLMMFGPLTTWAFSLWWPESVEYEVVRDSIQLLMVAGLPVMSLTAFLLGDFRRVAELETLSVWLGETEASRLPIRDALARALGDPTLAVSYWSGELQNWVSATGQLLAEPDGKAGRARHEIRLSASPIAAIEYDSTLLSDPHEVERAASLVALALERERLSVELFASRQAVIESRERLFGAAEAERRRISRGLHDGLQARLVLIGIQAQRIATAPGDEVAQRATALREHVDQAADELRAFVHDLVPPALIELGVVGAVDELVQAMPIPTDLTAMLPERLGNTVETTVYLVVAEALTNVVKHSGATHCTVSLRADDTQLHILIADNGKGGAAPDPNTARSGTGLAGIADRVAAIGGSSGVETQAQGGTLLWARIPYES